MVKSQSNSYLTLAGAMMLVIACYDASEAESLPAGNSHGVGNMYMGLDIINDSVIVFSNEIKINDAIYCAKATYIDSESFGLYQLIMNNDTISFHKNELYVWDSIYDINNDGNVDFNIKHQATKGFIISSFLFNRKENRLFTIPITRHELY